ncbi:MAG TPA: TetR family transcriptional regulator C-terminal domain-containing protein, partial [Burkholderiaceae bacterium]|nr:TetR family transcriptional regulator C-terminal domain-containing protein [Burkholderiaceae bacterium]
GAPDMSAAERLHAYMEEMPHRLDRRGNRHGCLIGKFSLELAPSSTPFSTLLSTMLSTWKASVQAILAEGQAEGSVRRDLDAADLATIVLSTIQGAVLLCLAHRSSEPMYVAAATVTKLISE